MTWPVVIIVSGVLVTVALWAIFVYIAVRGLRTEIPGAGFGPSLDVQAAAQPTQPTAMKVLLPIDGSAASVAAVQEVAAPRRRRGGGRRLRPQLQRRLQTLGLTAVLGLSRLSTRTSAGPVR